MSAWNDLVKKTFKMGKAKNPSYSLGDAMKDAKKAYKTGATTVASVAKSAKRRTRRMMAGRKSRRNSKK